MWNKIRSGDEPAYRELFNRYYPILCQDAMRFVLDQTSAEDIVQELFVNLWIKREQIDIRHSVKAYLKRSVTNRSLNYLEKTSRVISLDQKKHEQTSKQSLSNMDQQELSKIIQESIAKLPLKRREVFIMRRYQEMSYADIAESLDISERTVETHLRKARLFLRELLKPYIDHVVPIFVIICTYVRDFTFLLVLLLSA